MSEMIRSFIAFDIDSESLLRKFSEAQGILANTGAGLKLVQPRNLHITMRFLGNITLSMVDSIHEEMNKVPFTPFDVEIRGLGAFPSLKYTRVVWAGIRKGADELANISSQLEPRLQKLGFRPDPGGFSPHLTIARVKTGRNKVELARCIEELADYEFGIVEANCLKLKKSVLTPKGPIYSTLREVCH
ncbi:MAG: RNA 2',3'-cyclic phosphodiesterase [Candidatus Bathyarchaeota archaeon]|nr:MAG: RNA 2',3'-cyclic phosphodiesterase [Candidatus Bathyarchaeota archaeon]